MALRPTIVAVSSPPGTGPRAVVRLSGERAGALVAARLGVAVPPVRALIEGRFDDGLGGQPCMWLWMPGPASYTREDVAELHVIGAEPLVEALLAALFADGVEPAGPGEFTRRAFEHGRLDLTEAEGVLGLIEAADLAAARSAAQLLGGGLKRRLGVLRDGLEGLRALAEASLDFDSDETGHVATAELSARGAALAEQLDEALAFETQRESARGRARVVLAGRPNAGKSSLFNALGAAAEEEAALVSALAGSTRDGKAGTWLVAGIAVELFDAPGIEDVAAGQRADATAQRLAADVRRGADIVLWLVPAPALVADPAAIAADRARLPERARVLPVATQVDRLAAGADLAGAWERAMGAEDVLWTSTVWGAAGTGLDLGAPSAPLAAPWEPLEAAVAQALGLQAASPRVAEAASLGRELSARHRAALERGLAALGEARAALEAGIPLDLVAETLREATLELDAISGRTTAEDLLDRIFAGFCLGK